MSNNYPDFPGNNPYPYQPVPVAGKTSFGLALASIIAGVLGIVIVFFIFAQLVNGNQNDSNIAVIVQEIIGLIGLLLIVGSGILAIIGISLNKSRAACGAILGMMALPIMLALWLLTVLGFTALGIG